jgi:14-3-3 protein epsilon
MDLDRESDLIYMAKLSEQAERYDEMVTYMTKLAETSRRLNMDGRNLLSVAFKNVVGARRASWRVLHSLEEKEEKKESGRAKDVALYKAQVEDELEKICQQVLNLLDDPLLKELEADEKPDGEALVFFHKMKGDYYRYLAEFQKGEGRETSKDKAAAAYATATTHAAESLKSTNPIRLGLALNYSVFQYEIADAKDKACKLAKDAFDDAVSELDDLTEEQYKDSSLILQLLRDNLTLWTTPDDSGDLDD